MQHIKRFLGSTLVLQRTFIQLTVQRDSALAMGDIGGVVPLVPVGHEGKRRL